MAIIKPREKKEKPKPKGRYVNFNLHNRPDNEQIDRFFDVNRNDTNDNQLEAGSLKIFSPKSQEEVQYIVSFLKENGACFVNLVGISEEDTLRVLDFLSGAIFALLGQITRVQNNLFLLSLQGINVKLD
ncbi:MAG: cell division protein SepF [Spirochaetales bacterium]